MKRIDEKLYKNNKSRICSLYALYDLLTINGYKISNCELLLINLTSLLNCIEFNCKGINLMAFTTIDYHIEVKFFEKLQIPYIKVEEKFMEYLDSYKVILFYCYLERNVFSGNKPYYLGGLHSAILFRNSNKKMIFSDLDGVIELKSNEYKIIEKSRYVELYPLLPNGQGFIIDKCTDQISREIIKKVIVEQLKIIVNSFENERCTNISNVYFYSGVKAYTKLKDKFRILGNMGNDNISCKLFNIEIKSIIKSFLNQPDCFKKDICNALFEYGQQTGNLRFNDFGNELEKTIPIYEKMYQHLLRFNDEIENKKTFMSMLEEYLDQIYSISSNTVKLIKEYLESKGEL